MPDVISEDLTTLRVATDGALVTVTFDHPPINLFDPAMIEDLRRLLAALRADTTARVVVFDSANPDFFLGHADLNLFLAPRETVPPRPHVLSPLQTLFEDLRTLPQATIGILEGRAPGAAAEFLTSCDMVFAARGRAIVSQFETAVGVLPAATGSQRLPRLIGRSRALEVILGCQDVGADLAERYGLINRAFDETELRPFVDRLARRIAAFPAVAIAMGKVAVDAAELPIHDGLLAETHALDHTLVGGEAQRRMQTLLDRGAQTPDLERDGFAAVLETLEDR